jgi:hypothetical protein
VTSHDLTDFLAHGAQLTYTVDDAEEFVLQIARGDIDVPDITAWIDQRTTPRRTPAYGAWPQA